MDQNQLTGFGLIIIGLSLLVPLLSIINGKSAELFNIIMAIGGLSLIIMGALLVSQKEYSGSMFMSSIWTKSIPIVTAVIFFGAGFGYAIAG